jgi:hypothetical protein
MRMVWKKAKQNDCTIYDNIILRFALYKICKGALQIDAYIIRIRVDDSVIILRNAAVHMVNNTHLWARIYTI